MILQKPEIDPVELERRTGWEIKPEGACKGPICVPLPASEKRQIDAGTLSQRLRMALVHDDSHELWALGPESVGHSLTSGELPDITLPDRHGNPFSLRSLQGSKILLLAWASW